MNRIRLHSAGLLLLILLASAGPSSAALQADAGVAADTSAASPAQDDGDLDPVEARRLRFLAWAYAVIWILLAAYLVSIAVRLRSVRKELDRMRERLEGGGSAARGGPAG